jgi:hypothetical protein
VNARGKTATRPTGSYELSGSALLEARFTGARRLLIIACALLHGCGGGGGSSGSGPTTSPPDSTPAISGLQISRATAPQFEGNGSIQLTGSVNFSDAGGDVTTLHLSTSQGQVLQQTITGTAGAQSGTIQGAVTIDTSTIGRYTFEVYVTDAGGRRSNTLSGTFEVTVNDTGTRWTVRSLPLPTGSTVSLRRVRWLNGQFMAVGEGLFSSPDGVTWTQRFTGVSSVLTDVAWASGRYIAVATDGRVAVSADGASWVAQPPPAGIAVALPVGDALSGIAASEGRFVAVGTGYDPVVGQ